jgi:LysR family transcriptional activator of dmlA
MLEQTLGVCLLFRTTRRVAITEDGERVYRSAVQMLEQMDDLLNGVSELSQKPRGLLRISSSFGFGRLHVAPMLSALTTSYPELEVRLDLFDHLVDLAQEGIDLDIRIGNSIAPDLIARKLAPNFRILCASPRYIARRGKPKSPGDLATHDCLTIKERDHPFGVWRLSGPAGDETVKVSGPLSSNHGEAVHAWAVDGKGIMLRSLWDVNTALADGTLVQLLPGWSQQADIWAVYPSRLSASAKLRVCVEYFQRHFQGLHGQVAG